MSAVPSELVSQSGRSDDAVPLVARIEDSGTPIPPSPRGASWIDVLTAARRSGLSARRLRQLCTREWCVEGLAHKDSEGSWRIREDADVRIGRVTPPEALPFDSSSLTERQRCAARERKRVLDAWSRARAAGFRAGMTDAQATNAFLEALSVKRGMPKSSARTLRRWDKAYRADGLSGLVDERGRKRPDTGDRFLEHVRALWLAPARRSVAVCHEITRLMAAENGWVVPSLKKCQRFVSSIPEAVSVQARQGRKAFADMYEPTIERDYTTINSNDWWVADHSLMDVIVRLPNGKLGRPWLTAWMDCRSRLIVGWAMFGHNPNSDVILETFGRGVVAHGMPRVVYLDNGKDFRCRSLSGRPKRFRVDAGNDHVQGVFAQLDVEVTHAIPYNARAKTIERFFGTVHKTFCNEFPTWTGHNPQHKPERLNANLKRGLAPTLGEVVSAFSDWLEAYHERPHTGHGMDQRCPSKVFAEYLIERRTSEEQEVAILCMRPVGPFKVTRNGVRYLKSRYDDGSLYYLQGKRVMLRVDDQDLSKVYAFDLKGRFLSILPRRDRLAFNGLKVNSQDTRTAIAEQRRVRRKTREYLSEVRPHAGEDTAATIHRLKAEQARRDAAKRKPSDTVPVIKLHRSKIADELSAIRHAEDQHLTVRAIRGDPSISPEEVSELLATQPHELEPEAPYKPDLLDQLVQEDPGVEEDDEDLLGQMILDVPIYDPEDDEPSAIDLDISGWDLAGEDDRSILDKLADTVRLRQAAGGETVPLEEAGAIVGGQRGQQPTTPSKPPA